MENIEKNVLNGEHEHLRANAKRIVDQLTRKFYNGETESVSRGYVADSVFKRGEDGSVTAELIHHRIDFSHSRAAVMADIIAWKVGMNLQELAAETAETKARRLMENISFNFCRGRVSDAEGVCKELETRGTMRFTLSDGRTDEFLHFTLKLDRGHILYEIGWTRLRRLEDEVKHIVEAELIEPLCDEVYNAYWKRHTTDDPMRFIRENAEGWLEDTYEDPERGFSGVYVEGKTADGRKWDYEMNNDGCCGCLDGEDIPEDFNKEMIALAERLKEKYDKWNEAA